MKETSRYCKRTRDFKVALTLFWTAMIIAIVVGAAIFLKG